MRIRVRLAAMVTVLATLMLAASSGAALADRRVALVVGNAHYATLGTLANPTNDADDIAATLRGMGFAVTEATDATELQFADELSNFSTAAAGADVALFYYSGHGLQYQSENYLVPVDATLGNRFALEHGTIALNDVLSAIAEAHTALIYIDACRSFPIAGTFFGNPNERVTPIAGPAAVQTVANTFIGFSASPGQTAADGSGRNSPFTAAMLEALPKPGDVTQMFNTVSAQVVASTSGAQKPESFNGIATTVALVASTGGGGSNGGASDEEERAYTAAAAIGTAGAYRAFIARFPGGYYNELAREALAKLDASVPAATPAPSPSPADSSGPIDLVTTSAETLQQLMPQVMNGRPLSGLPKGLKEANLSSFGPTEETIGAWTVATAGDKCSMYTEAWGVLPAGWLTYRPWLTFGTSTGSRLATSAMFTTNKPDGSDFIRPGTASAIVTRSDGGVRKIAAVFNNTELAMLSPCVNAANGSLCLDTDAMEQMSNGIWLSVTGVSPAGANVAITYDVRGYANAARRIEQLCKANVSFLYGLPDLMAPAASAKE